MFQAKFLLPAALLCLLATTSIIYMWNVGDYLLFDDIPALSANELLHIEGNHFDNWRVAAFSSNAGPLGRPLTMLSFALQNNIEGQLSPVSLKVFNVLIHIGIGWLLYMLFDAVLCRLAMQGTYQFYTPWVALGATAIWLLHPLNVSTVLYAVQRMAQISTLFVVLGLLVYVRYRSLWADRGASVAEVIAAALWLLLITAMAVSGKENGALLLWLLPVVEVCFFRGKWAGHGYRGLAVLGWTLLSLPLLLIAFLFTFYPDLFLNGYQSRNFTLEQRLLTQVRLLWQYLSWLVWPNIFGMGFQHDDISLSLGWIKPWTTILSLLGWGSVLLLALWQRDRWPLLLFALLFYLVAHSMESSFLALEMAYEHRNYLPGTAVCLLVASILATGLAQILSHRQRALLVLAGLSVLALLLTLRANTWSSDLTLSRDNLARHPTSTRSNYFYASALLRQYRERDQLGLHSEDASGVLAAGYHYMELMHQQDSADIGALVMLHYLDSAVFQELRGRNNWLGEIGMAFEGRSLKASDRNALAFLLKCMGQGVCATPRPMVEAFLTDIEARYPALPDSLSLQYIYWNEAGADSAILVSILEEAVDRWPDQYGFYPQLIYHYGAKNNVAGVYRSLERWMRNDPSRYQLPLQQMIFSEADE